MIIIVGLGREKGDLTQRGAAAVKSADRLFVRTLESEAGRQIQKYAPVPMDDLYETAEDFDALNQAVAERVLAAEAEAGKDAKTVYCVDGDGFTDGTVSALYKRHSALEFIAGVSDCAPPVPAEGVQSFPAHVLTGAAVEPDTSAPLVVSGLYDRLTAGEAKLRLLEYYGGGEEVFLIGKTAERMPLADIDRQKKYGHNTYVFIPAQTDFEKERYGFSDLTRIMERLTAPDGCPWDKVQTHESILKNVLEEANELCEAIRLNDLDNLIEECGDVILQGVFHGDIGRRFGEFTTGDIIDRLCKKLISRHTHVFGADKAANPDEALMFWKAAKSKEKSGK